MRALAQSLAPETALVLERAVGRSTWNWAITPEAILQEGEQALLLGFGEAYYYGLGERAWRWLVMTPYGREHRLRPERVLATFAQAFGDKQAAFRAGLAHAQAQWRL